MEVQFIEKTALPSARPENHSQPQSFDNRDPVESLMDSVSREIRNRLVANISAYCDCV